MSSFPSLASMNMKKSMISYLFYMKNEKQEKGTVLEINFEDVKEIELEKIRERRLERQRDINEVD